MQAEAPATFLFLPLCLPSSASRFPCVTTPETMSVTCASRQRQKGGSSPCKVPPERIHSSHERSFSSHQLCRAHADSRGGLLDLRRAEVARLNEATPTSASKPLSVTRQMHFPGRGRASSQECTKPACRSPARTAAWVENPASVFFFLPRICEERRTALHTGLLRGAETADRVTSLCARLHVAGGHH